MNLPNQLTIGRLIMTLIFVAVMSIPIPYQSTIALWLFVIASITDYLDGMIARKFGLVTNFGKLMDPLVDKILTCSAFIMLCGPPQLIPPWVAVVILAREFLVTGLRLIAGAEGTVLAADRLGKWKTVFQISTAIFFLLYLASKESPMRLFAGLYDLPGMGLNGAGIALIALTLLFTVGSGYNYVWKNRRVLKDPA